MENTGEIFVGRAVQLSNFRRHFSAVLGRPGLFARFFARREQEDADLPRIYLFHGEGGLGKTTRSPTPSRPGE